MRPLTMYQRQEHRKTMSAEQLIDRCIGIGALIVIIWIAMGGASR
jgi:hypothetical protein